MLSKFKISENLIKFIEAVFVTKSLQFFCLVGIHDFLSPLAKEVDLYFICIILEEKLYVVDVLAVVESLVAT